MTESGGQQRDHAVVRLDHGDAIVTQAAAESMRRALLRHFERPGSPAREDRLTELRTNAARIDPDGHARAGGWLLEGRGNAFVWTERSRHGSMFHIHVAFLEPLADGTWRVSGAETEYVPLLNR
jgi:hypothetical protein